MLYGRMSFSLTYHDAALFAASVDACFRNAVAIVQLDDACAHSGWGFALGSTDSLAGPSMISSLGQNE